MAAATLAACTAESTVSVQVGGPGSVQSKPAGIDCSSEGGACAMTVDADSSVQLIANIPEVGSEFAGWSGACSGTDTCFVDATNDVAVGASFSAASRTLTIVTSGSGAYAVQSQPAGIMCGIGPRTCTMRVPKNTNVVLSAGFDPASTEFLGWGGEPSCSTAETCQVKMDRDHTVDATYALRLFLTLNVSGPGRVTGPFGLDCPGTKCRAQVSKGAVVTLHPEPDANASFVGWLGICPGMVDCTLTIDVQTTVTADFAAN